MNKIIACSLIFCAVAAVGCEKSGGGDAEKATAAAAFPAQDVPVKDLPGITIGVPPGAKLEGGAAGMDDRATLATDDYRLVIKVSKAGTIAQMKEMLGKAKTFKAFPVDTPEGFIVQMDEPSGSQFMVLREMKVGELMVGCESAMSKPVAALDKAQEAYAVCGSFKKK